MSEKMYPIPFKSLMNWIVTEYAREGEIFGVHTPYYATGKTLPIFGETIETPFGPAAGPNSQLAQNIIAAYFAGARFFEVKTVQKMDGEELARCVPRPCILAADEGYNQEWSTELEVPQAQNEYIKAWCALKVLSRVYGLGSPDGFVFNMSVGYDLEGIKGEKVNSYIDNMMDASNTALYGLTVSYKYKSIGVQAGCQNPFTDYRSHSSLLTQDYSKRQYRLDNLRGKFFYLKASISLDFGNRKHSYTDVDTSKSINSAIMKSGI